MNDRRKVVKLSPRNVGRPPTVRGDKFVGMRLPTELLDAVNQWGTEHAVQRSEAIRRLLELGLAAMPRRPVKPKDESQ